MKLTRRKFIKTASLSSATLVFPAIISSCNLKKMRPNIIFIMSDDHARNAVSCYNDSLIKTPHLDRIGREGIIFKNSFVTNSICAPSRATLLTGKYSHINGLRDNRDEFDSSQLTFPQRLQEAGYQTNIVGKWHLKSEPVGFDNWRILVGQGQYYNPVLISNGQEQKRSGYTTDIITDEAIDILKQSNPEKPFCLLLHHKAPHRNWMPDIHHLNKFKDTEIPIPHTFYDDYTGRKAAAAADMKISDMYLSFDFKLYSDAYQSETGSGGSAEFAAHAEEAWQNAYQRMTPEQQEKWDKHYKTISDQFGKANLQDKQLLEWKYQRYIKDYLRCVYSIDQNTGRLLDYIDQANLTNDTVMMYTSDQGFFLGEHGWYDKRFMYEESLSMPLLVRYPEEIKAGSVSDRMIANIDFAPTFLDYANVEIPNDIQGNSFRPITRSKADSEWRNAIYYHYYEYPHGWHDVKRHYGIRTERFKLIHFYEDIDTWELYDLKKDPYETKNIYNEPENEKLIEKLKTRLIYLQKKFGDKEALELNH